MPEPEDTLRESPVDFDSAVAYALHPEMRRLIILYVVGALLLPVGTSMLFGGGLFGPAVVIETALVRLVELAIGLVVTLVGAALFFGGLIGALFKLVADANILAEKHYGG